MVSALSSGILQIASFYNQNSAELSKTMQRLASSKKMLSPSDDISNYFRAQDLQAQADGWDPVISKITEWKGAMDVASTASNEISSSVQRLNELVNLSQQSTDGNQKDAYQTEFTQVANNIDKIVKNTYYESTALLNNTAGTTQATLYLNPDSTLGSTMTINLPVAVDSTAITNLLSANISSTAVALDYTHAATYVSAAKTANNTFLSDVSANTTSLNSFYNISSTIKSNTLSAVSNITEIDDATEIANYTSQSVHQQMASAMLAQANLSSQSVLSLYSSLGNIQR